TRNLWFVPLDGEPRQVTEGNHMLSVDDIGPGGVAVGTRSSYYEPGSLVTLDVDEPSDVRVL
ncbi:MAG: hypothetical protein GWM92_05985, partial [Gemmatimonadetes bacterium]|nr:hypothetical protein [Gemmatimonadota bacterium]NIT86729.1 hypothetical protein [Gemmatimonadota bacterium]NIU30590.1 hypothetical protein [Gemmatimonadota bacterium]NIU35409.1 hypothetical protein [Gemmatimonadota bacterium]NIV60956.1 hypothetical protein [Gemmatimonadota bacterium]